MKIIERSSGGGSGTHVGYSVEARVHDIKGVAIDPVILADGKTILGHEWTGLYFERGHNLYGVPGPDILDPNLGTIRLPLHSAIALAWTVIAKNLHCNIECQIVQHKLTYSYTSERKGVVDGLNISGAFRYWNTVDDVLENG